ncbi:LOW QUALITY PROTEIN: sperm-associated antigen 16 protein [Microcaecilia unicolor]|uniref:LOW QUALITY PROTEIN: sperm-associated antigen 16 protein n=1 Tax=Microcaecilia unicolor TaxID=1415580 RepID=A0A6P7YSP3_9AMPH|nr:LOW QUALITY PROTEIN: sperm-associated antigen 16 protein [Microcaecilia unicolor]
MAADTESFYLEQVTITDGSEDDYQYEEVPADDDFSLPEGDEDLEKALKTVQEQSEDLQLQSQRAVLTSKQPIPHKPEVIDDFLRNFLIKMGMTQTLECFQTEWYEMVQKGLFPSEEVEFVPDVYTHNQFMDVEIKSLKKELEQYKEVASKAGHAILKLQKERDFHRLHHKRVAQDKNRLINDIKRLKTHYASYEPLLRQLHEKYETLLRQKMLTSLERDRVVGQITGLQATLRSLESGRGIKIPDTLVNRNRREDGSLGPTQRALLDAKEKILLQEGVASYDPSKDPTKQIGKRYPKDSEFPLDTRVNPYLVHMKRKGSIQQKLGGFRQHTTIKAHELAISCMALHPRKEILVTGSDDHLWKMWSIIKGELIMTGDGHTDWISGCCFHPRGTKLATSSGDTSIRIWDFSKAECILTLEGHGHAVWDCSWHTCGDFLASCSMDKTSKIWDINSERCRYTMRGHMDSVNSIEFLPFSNTILTSSADKTLSLWDARMGLCAQTFYGHMHSCNDATFNMKGDTIASCDSYGVLKLWDVRKVAVILSFDAGPHPGNQVAFSPSGQIVCMASNDGTVKSLDLATGNLDNIEGHEDSVQSVIFDFKGDYMFSGGSDGVVMVWV